MSLSSSLFARLSTVASRLSSNKVSVAEHSPQISMPTTRSFRRTISSKIGLVAHDAMKKDMIEWVLWNSERLIGHKFYCTGTTGTLIIKALEEKHP